jgi:hypothetical protein
MTAGDGGCVAATGTVASGEPIASPLSHATPQAHDHLPGVLPPLLLTSTAASCASLLHINNEQLNIVRLPLVFKA